MNRDWCSFVLVAAALFGLAGCGGQKLDTAKLQPKIKTGVEQQARVKVRSVSCPSDVELKAGKHFKCNLITTSGKRAQVVVTQRDAKGNVLYQLAG